MRTIASSLILWGCVCASFPTFAQDPNFHIYLMFGQSNMEGQGPIEAQDRITNPRVMLLQDQTCSNLNRTYGTWYTAAPPLVRCWGRVGPGDSFGKTMAENIPSNITIGIVNTSVGGCSISLFQKGAPTGRQIAPGQGEADIPQQFNGGYDWMLDLAKKAQTVGVIKGILFHQGETNTNDQNWKFKVQGIVADLKKDLGLSDIPFLAGELLYRSNGGPEQGCCSSHNTEINKLPGIITNAYVISANGLKGQDGAHFTTAAYREFGIRYATKMLELVNTTSNLTPTVTLTAPANNGGACIGTSISIAATASISSGSVIKVDFYAGNTLIGTDNSAPYSYTWNNAPAGSHALRAIATSAASVASTAATVNFTVNALPTLAAYSNINNSTWQQQANVALCEGGEVMFGPHPYDVTTGWSWTGPDNFTASTREISFQDIQPSQAGTYTATFTNASSCTNSIDMTIAVNANPVVNITSPQLAEIITANPANINIEADVVGTGITSVQFYNENTLLGQDVSPPYSYTWNNVLDGSYTLSAVATDGNSCEGTSAPVSVIVDKVTGLEEHNAFSEANTFPNPFQNQVTIQYEGDFDFSVYTLSGIMVEKGSANNSVEVGGKLKKGLYFLTLQFGDNIQTIKIIKQ